MFDTEECVETLNGVMDHVGNAQSMVLDEGDHYNIAAELSEARQMISDQIVRLGYEEMLD